jgi:hypothetical protein
MKIRPAEPADIPSIISITRGIADYEKLSDQLEIRASKRISPMQNQEHTRKCIRLSVTLPEAVRIDTLRTKQYS